MAQRTGKAAPSDRQLQGMRNQLEDGTWLGSCDWGYCNREQVGWAFSDSDAGEEWMPICQRCSQGDFPPANDEPYPIDGFVSFDDVLPSEVDRG